MLFLMFLVGVGIAFGAWWLAVIPAVVLLFMLIGFLIRCLDEYSMEKAGYVKKVRVIRHKYRDSYFGEHEVEEERTEWVKSDPRD